MKIKIEKGNVKIEIRSSMYDKDESLFIERMMTSQEFSKVIGYIFDHSKEAK